MYMYVYKYTYLYMYVYTSICLQSRAWGQGICRFYQREAYAGAEL